jgi:uncharacterized protein (DUF2384 family)
LLFVGEFYAVFPLLSGEEVNRHGVGERLQRQPVPAIQTYIVAAARKAAFARLRLVASTPRRERSSRATSQRLNVQGSRLKSHLSLEI